MHELCSGTRQSYKRGCRCDLCKQAESAYKRDLRQRHREAVGEFVTQGVPPLSLVTPGTGTDSKSDPVCGPVESAILLEIGDFEQSRPGLVAVALSLAVVLDNPRATSSKPPAAGALVNILNLLRKTAVASKETPLASVRQMTKPTSGRSLGAICRKG
jgi:hypothetical protein